MDEKDRTLWQFGGLFTAAFAAGVVRGASHKHGLPHLPLESLLTMAGTMMITAPIGGKILAERSHGFLYVVGNGVGAVGSYIAEETGNFFGYLLG